MVATMRAAAGLETTWPRCCISLKLAPSIDCAAVAPRHTTTAGLMERSSASSHGRHAFTSDARGFLWMRRLPRGSHLKCFTALVTYTWSRGMRSEEHTSELQSRLHLVCRLLLEKKNKKDIERT